jgi:arsenate reductase (thioredoxin)
MFSTRKEEDKMRQSVLFLCPHSAAKSVIAAAYFQRLAEERRLRLRAEAAGTDPSPEVSPAVVSLLAEEGIDVAHYHPRTVTKDDIESALRVVSLGCPANDLPLVLAEIEHWDDVPLPSINLVVTRDTIRSHVEKLVEELASAATKR